MYILVGVIGYGFLNFNVNTNFLGIFLRRVVGYIEIFEIVFGFMKYNRENNMCIL